MIPIFFYCFEVRQACSKSALHCARSVGLKASAHCFVKNNLSSFRICACLTGAIILPCRTSTGQNQSLSSSDFLVVFLSTSFSTHMQRLHCWATGCEIQNKQLQWIQIVRTTKLLALARLAIDIRKMAVAKAIKMNEANENPIEAYLPPTPGLKLVSPTSGHTQQSFEEATIDDSTSPSSPLLTL